LQGVIKSTSIRERNAHNFNRKEIVPPYGGGKRTRNTMCITKSMGNAKERQKVVLEGEKICSPLCGGSEGKFRKSEH